VPIPIYSRPHDDFLESTGLTDNPALLAQTLRMTRLRLHVSVLPANIGQSAMLGLVIAFTQWDSADQGMIFLWTGLLMVALGIRGWLGWLYQQQPQLHAKELLASDDAGLAQAAAQAAAWLMRHRVGFFIHGMVWGGALAVLHTHTGVMQLTPLTMAIVAIAAGSLNNTTFDFKAALAFVLPALSPLCVLLLLEADATSPLWPLIMVAFMAASLIGARRAERIFEDGQTLRLAEKLRADEAQRQTQLALKTFELMTNSLADGVSVIGEDLVYRMVNDAWCVSTAVPREAAVGRKRAEVLPPSIANRALEELVLTCIRSQRSQVVRAQYDLPGNPGRYVETTYYPYLDTVHAQEMRCVVIVTRDVTAEETARQQLAATAHNLQLTLDSIDQGIVTFDAAGTIGIHNTRALTLMSLPPDLFERVATFDQIVDFQIARGDLGGDASFVDAYGARRFFAGGRINTPARYVRQLRSGLRIEVRTRQLPGGGMVKTFADVTDYLEAQRTVEESEAELRDLLGSFPGYIVAIDKHFRYGYANEKFAQLMEKSPQDIVGQHVRDILGEERFKNVQFQAGLARAGQRCVSTSHHPATARRAAVDLEVTHVAGLTKANGEQMVYVFGQDITARKQAEVALIAARDAAESASRAKSDFLSHMSHELRTPMNAILGFGQLLELDHQSDADRQDWGREVVKGGQHLLALINEVLDLARVESGKMAVTLEPLALSPILEDCLALVRTQADARHIRRTPVGLSAGLRVLADGVRLKQIVLNLLSNAIKYNVDGGSVTVRCERAPQSPGTMAQVSVIDTGNGLTPEQIGKLFQPFERLHASHEHIEGSGIGLVLTQRLVHLLNGQIGVISAPGQGSTFWFTLPIAP
jgi:PAS domain S-box-containing protein